jgi:hypothetical protein
LSLPPILALSGQQRQSADIAWAARTLACGRHVNFSDIHPSWRFGVDPRTAPHQVPPTASDADDARRSGDGSIDVEFYKARAWAIRCAAQVRFAQTLRRRVRLVLKRAHEFFRGRR